MVRLTNLITERAEQKVEKTIRDIEKNIEEGDVTEAILVLAKLLKESKYIKILDSVNDIENLEGRMPIKISQYRDEILYKLLSIVKNKYDDDIYMRISTQF